jgi:hypothetical protein
MTKSALDGMAEQIKEKYIPHLIEHDWEQHIGVILYGEVFQLKDSEYALGVVFGLFESGKEKEYFKTTQPNIVWETYKSHLDIDELSKLIEENQTTKGELQNSKKTRSNIADLLETHLDSTRVLPDGTVYKI